MASLLLSVSNIILKGDRTTAKDKTVTKIPMEEKTHFLFSLKKKW
jgi:hypothetical protein